MSLLKNTVWSATAAVTISAGRFLLAVVIARKLGVVDFGRFTFTQWLVDITFLCLAFGLNGCGSRFFAEYRHSFAALGAFARWFTIGSIAVVVAVMLVTPAATYVFGQKFASFGLLIVAGWAAAAALWALLLARAQGLGRFREIAHSNTVFVVVAVGGTALFPGESPDAVEKTMLLMMVATLSAAAFVSQKLSSAIDKSEFKIQTRKLAAFAANVWIGGLVAALVWQRGELSVIRITLTDDDIAQYSVALTLSAIAINGVMLLTGALSPHLATMWGSGNRAGAVRLSRHVTNMQLLFCAGLACFLIAFAKEIVLLCFGTKYMQAAPCLTILAVGVIGLASSAPNQLILLQSNARFNRNINIIGAVLLLALAVALVQWLGLIGAALARSAIALLSGLTVMMACRRWVDEKSIPLRRAWMSCAVTTGFAVCIYLLEPGLFLRAIACIAMWLLLLLMFASELASFSRQVCARFGQSRRVPPGEEIGECAREQCQISIEERRNYGH